MATTKKTTRKKTTSQKKTTKKTTVKREKKVDPFSVPYTGFSKAPGAKCDLCPLKEMPMAPGDGPAKANLVLVGEAPGREEIMQKRPFVGPSGKLMNRVLDYFGIKRKDVYVTNACLCRPPVKAKKQTPPNAVAVRACHERLVAEVRAREPEKIIAAGKVAAQAVLQTNDSISKLRVGGPKKSPIFDAEVIPTWHPAAALRSPDRFPSIIGDIRKLTTIKVEWEPTQYKVIEDTDKAIRFLDKQRTARTDETLTLDVETDHHASDSRTDPDFLCIGISHKPGASVVYDERVSKDPRFQQALRKYLADKDIKWGYHGGKFDIQTLWSFAPEARVDEDSMLAHYATDERVGTHDLEQVSTETLGAPNYKTEMREHLPNENASLRLLPKDILHLYNATDVDVTHRLLKPLHEEMVKDDTEKVYDRLLIPGQNALAGMEYAGIELDIPYLKKLEKEFLKKVEDREKDLREIADINPRSNPQLLKAFQDLGYEITSTDKNDLKFAAIQHPLKDALHAYRDVHKTYTTYIKGLMRRALGSRIHPSFNLQTTETGRLSSSDPNAQNIPVGTQIRDAFIAKEDHVLVSFDYKAIEYRLLAVLSEDEFLLDLFRKGHNFHKTMAEQLFGPKYNEKQYGYAKNTNFGIAYEQGAKTLAVRIDSSRKKAQELIDNWHKQAPRVRPFQSRIKQEVKQNGYLTSLFGRKRRFWLITSDNWHHVSREALNFPIQSPASDFQLESLIKLTPMLEGVATPVISVHDSLTFEVHKDHAMDVARTIKEVAEDTMIAHICPTPVDFKMGRAWGSGEEIEVA